MIDAARLNQRILIETRTLAYNAMGEETESWAEHSEPWAAVKETPGREYLKGDFRAEGKAVFQIRWRSLDSTCRVTWRDRIFMIESVTGTQREGFLWLHCRSVENEVGIT